jgi:hypothetical protein
MSPTRLLRSMGLTKQDIYYGCRESPRQRTSRAPIYHQRAQSNEFLLKAVAGTGFLTMRASI